MTLEIFLLFLTISSTITGLVTEAVKAILKEHTINYYANTLAGHVALGVSILICVLYEMWIGWTMNGQMLAFFLAFVILSWLCAMIGYDKVIQTISQFKTYNKSDEE